MKKIHLKNFKIFLIIVAFLSFIPFIVIAQAPPPPPPLPDACDNIDGYQETIPDGMQWNGVGNCVPVVVTIIPTVSLAIASISGAGSVVYGGGSATSLTINGLTVSLSPQAGTPTFTSNISVTSLLTTTPGTYTVTIVGYPGPFTHRTTFTVTVNASPFPDLTADTPIATFNTGTALTGQPNTFYVGSSIRLPSTIRNRGGAGTPGDYVTATLQYTRTDPTIATDADYTSLIVRYMYPISAGSSTTTDTDEDTPYSIGLGVVNTYYIRACADLIGEIAESNEKNNCSSPVRIDVIPLLPDLTAGIPTATFRSGTNTGITNTFYVGSATMLLGSTISNVGGASAGTFTTRFQYKPTSSTSYTDLTPTGSGWPSVSSLSADANTSVQFSLRHSADMLTFNNPGTYDIRACADYPSPGAVKPELDDINNNCSSPVTVTVIASAPIACTYTCSFWNACTSSGTQTCSTIISTPPSGCGTPPPLSQSCVYKKPFFQER